MNYLCSSNRGLYKTWHLTKRYSEFNELYEALEKVEQYSKLDLEFPSRFSIIEILSSKSKEEKRKPMLEKYINGVLSLGSPYATPIIDFLCLQRYIYDDVAFTAVAASNISSGNCSNSCNSSSSSSSSSSTLLSGDDQIDFRGVKLALLQAVRDYAKA